MAIPTRFSGFELKQSLSSMIFAQFSFFNEMGTAGIGAVVHNCSGSVLGALSQRIQLPTFAATEGPGLHF
nr:hypothetical protein CFP56_79710 [Quercus suber]